MHQTPLRFITLELFGQRNPTLAAQARKLVDRGSVRPVEPGLYDEASLKLAAVVNETEQRAVSVGKCTPASGDRLGLYNRGAEKLGVSLS